MKTIQKSLKLADVCYDIRGPVLEKARQMEEEGHKIIKLNIGNLAPFGFDAPEEIVQDMIRNMGNAAGYTDSKGLFAPRKAIMQYCQEKKITGVSIDDVYLGNGASELIVMSMNGLLNSGDEVLVPAPDCLLWTASVSLSGGNPVHYICDEQASWYPDIDDIKRKITTNTRAIVVINPNNPTGALYPTLNGLSKNYRSCGYRAGWMVVSGEKRLAKDYIEGLNMLASMRLCANVPGQFAIQTALGGYQSINDLVAPQGRLTRQRDLAHKLLTDIPGVTCVKPKSALYMFPRLDPKIYPIEDDQQFAYELLAEERVLIVQGTGFNWPSPDHFRVVFLPNMDDLEAAFGRIAHFLDGYRRRHAR
ncbi:MAG: pyridoxal phosphate-dependent aminotransferase [Oxalobacteraceae bacterium]|nr:pyridoxal phosphate-dependent aminotransferase [Oxalobacteraceae bacterium]